MHNYGCNEKNNNKIAHRETAKKQMWDAQHLSTTTFFMLFW